MTEYPVTWTRMDEGWVRWIVDDDEQLRYGLRVDHPGEFNYRIAIGRVVQGCGLLDGCAGGQARSLDDALGMADDLILQVMFQDKWRADLGL